MTKPKKTSKITLTILAIITLLFFVFAFFYPEIVKKYTYGALILFWAIAIFLQTYKKKTFIILIISILISTIILKFFLFNLLTNQILGLKNTFQLAIPIISVIIVFVIMYWAIKLISYKIKPVKK